MIWQKDYCEKVEKCYPFTSYRFSSLIYMFTNVYILSLRLYWSYVKNTTFSISFLFSANISTTETILMNVNADGFYRVNYDGEMWEFFIRKLKSPSFEACINLCFLLNSGGWSKRTYPMLFRDGLSRLEIAHWKIALAYDTPSKLSSVWQSLRKGRLYVNNTNIVQRMRNEIKDFSRTCKIALCLN